MAGQGMNPAAEIEGQRSTVTVAGCRVSLLRGGAGPTLLFLHGAGGGRGWSPFLALLAERFDVIAPDHPGYGQSETPDWLDTIHDMAFFYLDFLEALQLESVHLVGASFGGWIAAEMAVRSTARLKTLSLVAPAGIHVKGVAKPDMFLLSPQELTPLLFHEPGLVAAALAHVPTPEEEEAALRARFMSARLAWQPRMHDPHLAKWLHRIDCPTQLLWGREDRFLPAVYAEHWQRLIPRSTVTWFERCGHSPQLEQPKEFAAAIAAFAAGGRP